ncbi:hypothetical protein EV363DRAFT_1418934 [Boletus edulis]|nr:hypothetical protein EV363DRAFT_1418934 [Boletus edulis]
MSLTRAVSMTHQTEILAWTLSYRLITIRPINRRHSGAKSNVPCLAESCGMIKYLLLILFVANHITCSLAWSWTTHQSPPDLASAPRVAEDVLLNSFDAELSQAGIDGLLSNKDVLQSYQQKPDCFQNAISLVKARCEESRMDEQERIQAAIGMTMCELATARHYLPPMECAAYVRAGHKASSPTPKGQARCVDALSRSAQFWSSYSGYLREIPQLCFTFRRWIDIDTAKDIYRNITEEKAFFVRFLIEREKASKTTQDLWGILAEEMRNMLEALRLASNGLKDTSDILTMTNFNSSQSLLMEVQSAIHEIEDRDRVNHEEIMTKFYSMLERVERDHSDHLLGFLPAIQSSITYELSTAFALIKDESLRNRDAAAHVERRMGLLESGLSALQNSLEQLTGVMDESSKLLEGSLMQARSASVIQGETMASMAHLMEGVHLLSQTTHAELASINRTASALKESLIQAPSSEWLKAVVVTMLQHFPGMPLLNFAMDSRTLQLVSRMVYVLWHGTRFFASLLVSAFILIGARGRPPFGPRAAPGDREAGAQAGATTWETDVKPPINRSTRPRTRLPRRSVRSRYSRIPDRLCRPSEDSWL